MRKELYMISLLILVAGLINASLVAEYHFEGNESIALDTSGNNNHCSINNASKVSGVQGYGLSFNGFDSYLDCGNDSSLNFGTGDFTIMAWVKTNGIYSSEPASFVNKQDQSGTASGYYAAIFTSNALSSLSEGFGYSDFQSSISIINNQWHHIVIVRDSQNTTKIYIDGVEDTGISQDCSGCESVSDIDNIANLIIGGDEYGALYNDSLDEIKMWNEAKDDAFILQTYNDEKPYYSPSYTLDDFVTILFDGIGRAGTFIISKITIIGSLLLIIVLIIIITKHNNIIKF